MKKLISLMLALIFIFFSNGLVMAAPEYRDANPDVSYSTGFILLPNDNLLYIQYGVGRRSELYKPDFDVMATAIMHRVTGMGHLLGFNPTPSANATITITDMNTGAHIGSGGSETRNYGDIIEELPGNLLLIKVYEGTYLRIIDLSGNTVRSFTTVRGEVVKDARLYNGNKVRVLFEQSDGTVKDYWIDYVTYKVKENPTAEDLSVGVYYPDKYNLRDIEDTCILPNGIQLYKNIISKDGHIIANIAGNAEKLKYIYNEANGRLYMVIYNGGLSSKLGKPRMISNATIDRITELQAQDITSTSAKITMNRGNLDPSYNIKVQYKRDGDQWVDLPDLTGFENSLEIPDLLPDTNYMVRVRTDFIDLFLGRTPSDGDWQPEQIIFRTKSQLHTNLEGILGVDTVSPDSPNNKGLVTKEVDGHNYVDLGKTFNNLFTRTTNLENSMVPVIQSVTGLNNSTATVNGSFTVEIEAYGATEYRAKNDVTAWTAWTTNNTITLSGISKGVKKITVEARNAAGKVSSKSMTIFSL